MRAKKSNVYLIKKDTSGGINKKNKNILTKLHNEYTIPFHQKNMDLIEKQMQSANYTKIIRDFKPFLSRKKSSTFFINNIALMSLAGIERSINIEVENKSLKAYIKMLEDEKKQAINGDINTSIDVNVSFSMEYLYYIEKYGIPLDGIFDPVKLSEFL
jgi:hypothetical protein